MDGQSSDGQQDGQTRQKYAAVQHVGSSFLPNSSPTEALLEATHIASARLPADAGWVQNLPRAYEDTMEAWVVRDAREVDQSGLRSFYGTAFAATYGPTLGQPVVAAMLADLDVSGLRSMLPGKDERAAVATLAGQIAGSAVAAERGLVAYLWGMYVHPAHQRTGVGTALLRHVAGWLSPSVMVEARVLASSPWAVAFYGRHGFREVGREPFEAAPGCTLQALVMAVPCAVLLERLGGPLMPVLAFGRGNLPLLP